MHDNAAMQKFRFVSNVFFSQAESWIRTQSRVVLSCQTSVVHTQVHMKGNVVKSPHVYQGWVRAPGAETK